MISQRDVERWFESPHYRKKCDWICIDQPKVIREWSKTHTIGQIMCSPEFKKPDWMADLPCLDVPQTWLTSVTKKPSHMGLMVVFERPTFNVSHLMRSTRTLVLDGIQDPGNMGTMIRAMVAFGCNNLCLTPNCVDPFHPKSVTASTGAIIHIQGIYYEQHWRDWITSTSHPIYVLDPLACHSIWDVSMGQPYVLVCGSEGRGIQSQLIQSVRIMPLSIPISDNMESLNAAMSVGIALNHLSRGLK